ncbi:DUF5335 family protein [Lyngbya confervoides]|uniref:DUF5335 domain-containing protein n=1 Tax=Lyngbya confervoides BDU141951 TaxID=1574623 RepID=A0ABD4T8U9_9CYAN|nr:DUF5335 family protein [Lyngbya confervoides]MCM1984944.1 DUF5335 domain-containing protein [Lyngbya confervoides BDU141951]
MLNQTIANTQEIPRSHWVDFFNQLTQQSRGRRYTLEICNADMGVQTLAKHATLSSITCDPLQKGDDIVISAGLETLSFSHIVSHPTALWVAQDLQASPIALEILDAENTKTILRFEEGAS